jgi:hypothetical protein
MLSAILWVLSLQMITIKNGYISLYPPFSLFPSLPSFSLSPPPPLSLPSLSVVEVPIAVLVHAPPYKELGYGSIAQDESVVLFPD